MSHTPPKSVTIGGVEITVRIVPDLDSWGEYHADAREILLSSRSLEKLSTMRETIRHEMLHAALDISGLSYLERYEEEALVRCIENVFHPAWSRARKQIELEN